MGSGWFTYGVSPRPDRDLPGCPSTLFFASTLTPSDDLKANMDRGIRTPASGSRGSAQPSPIEPLHEPQENTLPRVPGQNRYTSRRLPWTIWQGIWIIAAENVRNSIPNRVFFSARCFWACRGVSGTSKAAQAFRLQARLAMTM